MRPMVLIFPAPAMPTTSVANASGAMIDLIRRRKIWPSRRISLPAVGKIAPNAMPATSATRIQVVSEMRNLRGAADSGLAGVVLTGLPILIFREGHRKIWCPLGESDQPFFLSGGKPRDRPASKARLPGRQP